MGLEDNLVCAKIAHTAIISKIYKGWEINEKSNVQKMHIANSDKLVSFYSLVIIFIERDSD